MGSVTTLPRSLTNFRVKDRGRFADPELVAVRYETACREVFDYHEAICDLIDAERRNCIEVSLFTLARIIHDEEGFTDPAWFERRRRMLLALRDRDKPLVVFQGEVANPHEQLAISLPEDTYVKWHTDGGAKSHAARNRPRKPDGTFLAASTKDPHKQDIRDGGHHNAVVDPQASTASTTTQHHTTQHHSVVSPPPTAHGGGGESEGNESLPASPRSVQGTIRQAQRDLGSHAAQVIVGMIARRNGASDRMLTPDQELQSYWKPACTLLADHGSLRLREALNAAAAASATSIRYAETVCGRLRDDAAAATATASTNPDVGTGDWDHLPTGEAS